MLSGEIYKSFLKSVVKTGAFSEDELDRGTAPPSDEIMKRIRTGRRLDHRLPYLARVSGKGGVDGRGVRHDSMRNISLLEHATSVARGALVFAEQDLRAAGEDSDEIVLSTRLARVTAVGFLHDADKMIGQGREMLDADTIKELMQRYCVDAFLDNWKASASPGWMLAMIDQAEISRAGRIQPGGTLPSLSERADAAYIRCADRVEGKFLTYGPRAAVDELNSFEGFRAPSALRDRWRTVEICQPHIPFILDALHIGFANGCAALTGFPPLIEVHQDGRLIAIVPNEHLDAIRDHALNEIARRFSATARISINNKYAIEILDARTTVESLRDAVSEESVRTKLLPIHKSHAICGTEIHTLINETTENFGFTIAWPSAEQVAGAMVRLQPGQEDIHHETVFENARMLAVSLGCKSPKHKKNIAKIPPSSDERETALLKILDMHKADIPDPIRHLDHAITRRSLLALFAGGACEHDASLADAVLGQDGLLGKWLDGTNERAGLNAQLPADASASFVEPVRDMLAQALDKRFVPASEDASRRCHFTNEPVDDTAKYQSKSEGIYALKVSAFSGREGRPESHNSSKSGTYLSSLARAEHTLRFRDNHQRDGKNLPFLLSSPSVNGLFASLAIGSDTDIVEISTYDICALDPKRRKTEFSAFDSFERRILVGRYESQESGLKGSLDMVLRIIRASLRTGRTIHVFQGAPHDVRDRVYFDTLPQEIERGLGRKGFRIEDLETVRDQLHTWNQVCGTNGLGVAAATAMMDPATRLAALCEAVNDLDRNESSALLKFTLLQQAQGLIMTDQTASPIIRFARAMTGFQSGPHRDSSQADRTRGMRLALEALDQISVVGTTDRETMICAVVAEIENAAERETDKQFTKRQENEPTHKEALTCAAEIFADEVWPDVFWSRPPDSKARRSAIGIYRVAFERAHQLRKDGQSVFPS